MTQETRAVRLLDPRGCLHLARLALALRPDPDELARSSLLIYDNAKMEVGAFDRVLPVLKDRLAANGITRIIEERASIRGSDTQSLDTMARRFQATGAGAVVMALADMGISPAMVALAIALEKLGMPTVCLTAGPGSRLARAHAHYRAGRLCLIDYDIHPGSSSDVITRLVNDSVPQVLAMLTANGDTLNELARIDHDVDPEPAAADGWLETPPHLLTKSGDWDLDAVHDHFASLHLGDGLPFIPPTPERYQAMLAACADDPEQVLFADIGPSGTPMRVRDALVAAVMAGCRPPVVPILLAALRALGRPAYGLRQAVTTSFSGGHLVLVSGPLAQAAGLHGGQGCLGPGFRANAGLGRAVNLALINVCRSVPGKADLACLSSPAEFSYCLAEDPALSPWPTLSQERFDDRTTCVMVLKAEPPHAMMDFASSHAASLMGTLLDCCTTLGSNNAYVPGPLVVVLTPDHASLLAESGYDKNRLRREIHQQVKTPVDALDGRGIVGITAKADDGRGNQRVTRSPDDIQIVVAGGKGGHSAVILPWSIHADTVVEPVVSPASSTCR